MIRVSRVGGREGDSFISPGVQRERIEASVRSHGNTIGEWFEDLDQSGGKWERPGFQAALARCEAGELSGIVVHKLDRFARSVADAARAIRQLDACGCELVSVAEGLDPSTPYGRFGRNIMFALAELELEQRKEGLDTARERAVARGMHLASRTPTGYQKDAESGRLVIREPDASVVREVFHASADGVGPTELAAMLTGRGVRGAHESPRWTRRAVTKLLQNRAYLGEARSGEFVHPDAHPALVTREEWESAQRVPGSRPTASSEHLLSGLIRCAGCRHVLHAGTKIRKGVRVREYACRRDYSDGRCPTGTSIRGSIIEPVIVAEMFARIDWHYSGGERMTDDTDAALERVDRAERLVAEWRDDSESAELLGRDSFLAGLRSRVDDLTAAQEAYADARSRSRLAYLPNIAGPVWDELSVSERRQILAGYIDTVVLRGLGRGHHPLSERVRILGRGEMPDDWPRRGTVVPLEPVVWDALPEDSRISTAHDG